jgi:hypothetical protein
LTGALQGRNDRKKEEKRARKKGKKKGHRKEIEKRQGKGKPSILNSMLRFR